MKKYVVTILLLMIGSTLIVKADNDNLDLSLLGKVFYIDPGHGGIDPGAIYKELEEGDINLQISEQIELALEKKGAIVYLTRYDDYDLSVTGSSNKKRSDLSQRAKMINESDCDLYISIHLNSNVSSTWHGAQVYYTDNVLDNKKIAEILQNNLIKNLNSNRKATKTNKLYLNTRINRPGVLFEVGFLSNPSDRYLLKQQDYQKKVAEIVVKSVNEFLN